MRAEDLCIDDLLQMDPTGGVIRFGGRRTLLFDAVALGILRAQLVEVFGVTVARGFLTRLGYVHGRRTAEDLKDRLPWDDETEYRRAGGRLHRLQGMVEFEPVSGPDRRDPEAVAEAIWRASYEAEQHILHLGLASEPVCWTLCGFASGYLSQVMGQTIYALETQCVGCNDAVCHMVAKTEAAWGDAITPHLAYYERDCLDASLHTLKQSIRRLEDEVRSHRNMLGSVQDTLDTGGMVARSTQMQTVLHLCRRAARVDSTVLIFGESGVGKERIARFIHDQSDRTGGPFVAINCGALPQSLLESELFGHIKGAFTGATHDRPGLFEAAHGGTLFLDEIGEVPPPLQVRLLRVLQEREVRRVGENQDRKVDVRVLAATNRALSEAVAAGEFREDLWYRLKVIEVEIPPLRERPDDILPLARLKLREAAAQFRRKVYDLTSAVAKRLVAHDWPGNVRQLHNAVERAVVFAEADCLDVNDFPDLAPGSVKPADEAPMAWTGTLQDMERTLILETLKRTEGNRAEAARRLNIGEATLFRKIRQYRQQGYEV